MRPSAFPWVVGIAVAMTAVSCSTAPVKAPRHRMSVKEIVEASKPAIVRIESEHERVGTGFAIDPNGVIATNLHVVAGAKEIQVKLLDGRTFEVDRVLNLDADRDLALLAVKLDKPMPYLAIGDSDAMEAGDPVVAIGNPLGVLDYTVSDGLISSVRVVSDQFTILQISAPISQGSSGGPLFNPYGEVIGVTTAIFNAGQNLNFAVPSKYIKPLVAEPKPMSLPEFAAATVPPDEGGGEGGEKVKIERHVPIHDVSVLDGCDNDQLAVVAQAISEAIESGAPLYNQGNHAACFQIYEGTAIKYAAKAACPGVRKAFQDGLDRAETLTSPTEKAWALRDTFDGLLEVMVRRARAQSQP